MSLIVADAAAEGSRYTNGDFLAWTKRDRDQWLEGAILMAGHMAHLHDEAKGRCVWDWYLNSASQTQADIFAAMMAYPEATPSGTLIALMRRACGGNLIEGER